MAFIELLSVSNKKVRTTKAIRTKNAEPRFATTQTWDQPYGDAKKKPAFLQKIKIRPHKIDPMQFVW